MIIRFASSSASPSLPKMPLPSTSIKLLLLFMISAALSLFALNKLMSTKNPGNAWSCEPKSILYSSRQLKSSKQHTFLIYYLFSFSFSKNNVLLNKALAKWVGDFTMNFQLFGEVVKSIHCLEPFGWHMKIKKNDCSRISSISISRQWKLVEDLSEFFFGMIHWGILLLNLPFHTFVRWFHYLKVLSFYHWDSSLCTWKIETGRNLKKDELADFILLLARLDVASLINRDDAKKWSIDSSGALSVSSLSKHLSLFPLQKQLFSAIWK